ncbi:MAG: hypothetical protein M0Z55_10100, partial [Peptococcaceae bacterium]|nr:hypothetical protein [Peptococcaceae bacterium]
MRKSIKILILTVICLLLAASGVLAAGIQPTIDVDHMIIVPGDTGFQVQEIFNVTNSGAKPYLGTPLTGTAGKPRNGWLFPVPSGFTNLQVQGYTTGDTAVFQDGVQLYAPLKVGLTQFSITYDLPQATLPVTITKKLPFYTGKLSVYTPKSFLIIKSADLVPGGAFQISGEDFLEYDMSNLMPGQAVTIPVNQAPAAAPDTTAGNKVGAGFSVKYHPDAHVALFMSAPFVYTNPHIWAGYLLLMLVIAITAAVLYYRMRTRELYGAE